MATEKVTVTLGPDTLLLAREQAATDGVSLSAWLDRAARDRLRVEGARAMGEFFRTDEGHELLEDMRHAAALRSAAFREAAA
jgi:hypothetical protein